ncbi:MAG: hypothetical protein ACI837_001020 [Crocinitomicaceae bacterium]|jgi:hypothetical protein
MKRILLLSAIALFTGATAMAQCTPDPAYTTSGVYPDSATGFGSGCVNVLYEQLITNVVPIDTTVEIVPGFPTTLAFDSAVIVGVTGLPPGFTYSCYDADNVVSPVDQCAYEGGTTGCVLISGTAAPGDEGTYNLVIDINAYVGGIGTPNAFVVDYYTILIETTCSGIGLTEEENSKFKLYPNPVNQSFTLDGLAGTDVNEISVTNAAGKILSTNTNVTSGSIDMDVAHLDSGVYFVRIAHGTSVDVIRFIKE